MKITKKKNTFLGNRNEYFIYADNIAPCRLTFVSFGILDSESFGEFSKYCRRLPVRTMMTLLNMNLMLPFQFVLKTISLNSSIGRTVECTSSVLQALILFGDFNSEYRSNEIKENVNKAAIFIESNQNKDGSWFV